jgi:hypothetical protein
VLEQNNCKAAIAKTQLEPIGENRDRSDGCWRTKPDRTRSQATGGRSHSRPKQKALTGIWLQTKIKAANESAEQRKVDARSVFLEEHNAGEQGACCGEADSREPKPDTSERLQKSIDALELSPGGGGSDEEIGNDKANHWRRANAPDRNKQRGKIGLIEGKMKIAQAGPGRTQQENLRSRTNTEQDAN